jgi:hypothetical protein
VESGKDLIGAWSKSGSQIVNHIFSDPTRELLIKALFSAFGIYIYIEDYMKIPEVKYLLVPTLIFLFFIFIIPEIKSQRKRYIALALLIMSAVSLALMVIKVKDIFVDLHKNQLTFLLNYIFFILSSLLIILLLDKIIDNIMKYFRS